MTAPVLSADHGSAPALARLLADALGAEVETVPAGALADRARGGGARIVVGEAEDVRRHHALHHPPCPVAVAAGAPPEALGTVAVAYDESDGAQRALGEGLRIACAAGATLRLVGVADPRAGTVLDPMDLRRRRDDRRRRLQEVLGEAVGRCRREVESDAVLLEGDPADELRRFAASGVDLLCCGTRGRGAVAATVLGSVTRALLHHPPCALLLVPSEPGAGAPRAS